MDILSLILLFSQLAFIFIVGVYFFSHLRSGRDSKSGIFADSKKELAAMKKLRDIKLAEPLNEATRPNNFNDIIGQESGLRTLKAAICTPNPQHVIIYGPPGVGKTAAARIIFKEALKNKLSPFRADSPFVELDATILQFDERSIADPLIGSVHDPIYHGAGSYGMAGIPQPKPGAVTKAHGGILFIDEIGELNNVQLNRLLKVLEDRKAIVSSSYYSKSNKNIPRHIHDIFENGLPADFRLIGATTKEPSDIPEALRSRCREIHFRTLGRSDLNKIAINALNKTGLKCEKALIDIIAACSENGRDAVNMVANAASLAIISGSKCIEVSHIEEIREQSENSPTIFFTKGEYKSRVGSVLVPVIAGQRALIAEIEAVVIKSRGTGKLIVNGIVLSEEMQIGKRKFTKKSAVIASVENAIAALKTTHNINVDDCDIYLNFTAPTAVEGPSAGCAVFCALYSAIHGLLMDANTVITGEMSITGRILPVGQIRQKIEAAKEYGAAVIIIPKANEGIWQYKEQNQKNSELNPQIICTAYSTGLIEAVFKNNPSTSKNASMRLVNYSD